MKRDELVIGECYALVESRYCDARRAYYLGVLPEQVYNRYTGKSSLHPVRVKPAFMVEDRYVGWEPKNCRLAQIYRTWTEHEAMEESARLADIEHQRRKDEYRAAHIEDARKVRDALDKKGYAGTEPDEFFATQLADGQYAQLRLDDIRRLVKLAREGALHLNDPEEKGVTHEQANAG